MQHKILGGGYGNGGGFGGGGFGGGGYNNFDYSPYNDTPNNYDANPFNDSAHRQTYNNFDLNPFNNSPNNYDANPFNNSNLFGKKKWLLYEMGKIFFEVIKNQSELLKVNVWLVFNEIFSHQPQH